MTSRLPTDLSAVMQTDQLTSQTDQPPIKHDTLTHCWPYVVPASQTVVNVDVVNVDMRWKQIICLHWFSLIHV